MIFNEVEKITKDQFSTCSINAEGKVGDHHCMVSITNFDGSKTWDNSERNPFHNERERNKFVNLHNHTLKHTTVLSKAPNYALNRERYVGSPNCVLLKRQRPSRKQVLKPFSIHLMKIEINNNSSVEKETLNVKEKNLLGASDRAHSRNKSINLTKETTESCACYANSCQCIVI